MASLVTLKTTLVCNELWTKEGEASQHVRDSRFAVWFAISFLLLVVGTCFYPALFNDFTNWDDPLYVTDNDLITSLSWSNIRSIFSSFVVGNYHPLTMLSLALDFKLYHIEPFGFHLTNVLIHLANVVLVFAFCRSLTSSTCAGFIAALLFGIHPLRVESVAWVSERKDVLYSLFYLGSMSLYVRYVRAISRVRSWSYAGSLIMFILALLSKGQAVTLPLTLLLIDYVTHRRFSRQCILEKVPFFGLALGFGMLAIVAQRDSGAIPDMPTLSLSIRVLLACSNILMYAAKCFVPFGLSAFYPYPQLSNWHEYLLHCAAAAFVVGFAVLSFMGLRNRPIPHYPRVLQALASDRFVLFAILFFIIHIALLLQVLPVGACIIAERYTYLASAGPALLLGYGFSVLRKNAGHRILRYLAPLVLTLYVGYLGHTTIERNKVWRNSETLWTDVIERAPQAVVAYLNRGSYYQLADQPELALADFNTGLSYNPEHSEILANRCDIRRVLGYHQQSIADCTRSIELNPNFAAAYTNRGITYSIEGRYEDALSDFDKAIELEPNNPKLHSNRGNVYDSMGMFDTAIENYSRAISLRPEYFAAYYNRGKTKMRKGDFRGAVEDLSVSLGSEALQAQSYYHRALAYSELGRYSEALSDLRAASKLGIPVDPNLLQDIEHQARHL